MSTESLNIKSNGNNDPKKQLKSFLAVFFTLIIITNTFIYFFMRYDISLHRKRLLSQEEKKVDILKTSTENCIRSVVADLLYLSLHPLFKQMVNSRSSENREILVELFIEFSRKTGLYDQIRFINLKGQELIRVNHMSGSPASVPELLLQNKAHRYYFKSTAELNAGKIFMSPMDLNMEDMNLELPFKPMIRFGTPVFNLKGEKIGILIINFLCNKLFSTLESESGKYPEFTVLINSNSYWLRGLNKQEEWGFMIPDRKKHKLSNSNPDLWQKMETSANGQLYTGKTLYTFQTVYPRQRNIGQSAERYSRSGHYPHNPADRYFWKIATIIPEEVLSEKLSKTYRRWLIIFLVSFILVSFTSWRISISAQLKEDAISTLRAAHSDLEIKVKERTLEILEINKQLQKEIGEKKESEKKIMHLNSVISAIRNINKKIVKIKDSRELLQSSCSILTQTRGYYSAWTGLLQSDGTLEIVATSGVVKNSEEGPVCYSESGFPECISALRGNNSTIIIEESDRHCECPFSSGHKDSAGIASRLMHHQKLYGYIVISVSGDFITNDEELKLIQELSEDIAYALYSIEQEQSREIAEKALKSRTLELTQRLKELNCLFEISKIVETPGIRISHIIQGIVDIIPDSMKNSERTCARLIYADRHFQTTPYTESDTVIKETIYADTTAVGTLEVYLHPLPHNISEEFTIDEANLIQVVAERIGKIVEHSLTYRKNKVIEEALKESEEKYRLLIQNADEAIFITIDGLIKFPNPKTEQLLGTTRKQLLNENFSHFVHPEDLPYYVHEMHNREHNEAKTLNFRILSNDGLELVVELNTVSATWEHKDASLNILRDVTKQKNMEDSLRQSQKMEAIGTLAGGIAHDFNNILSAIFGYTELSLGKIEQKDYLANNLKKILRAGTRARDLIQQILTFSRRSEMEFKPIQVSKIINEVSGLLRASLPSTIEIKLNIDCNDYIMGDHVQLHQILMNLATNSGYAMRKKGGILDITLKQRKKPLNDGVSGIMEMIIADTGEGMTEDVKNRIFDPFFTTKPQGQGTGMGLSVVHGIVKSHEGYMIVNSQPGQGTIITIQLPTIIPPKSRTDRRKNKIKGGDENILFVDDEPAITEIGKSMLQSIGYSVTICNDSTEALKHFQKAPDSIDLLITDKTMPQLTGEDLAAEFKKIRPDIPIIICTGFTGSEGEHSSKELIHKYLEKPILKAQLAESVRDALDKK